jgi:hypothetical protein
MLYELLLVGSLHLIVWFFWQSEKVGTRLPGLSYHGQTPGALYLPEVGTL